MSKKEEKFYSVVTKTGSVLAVCSSVVWLAAYIWKRSK